MLNTKYSYQFTDILKRPIIGEAFRYMKNNERIEDKCRLNKLFCLLYDEPYHLERIRPFKVALERDEMLVLLIK